MRHVQTRPLLCRIGWHRWKYQFGRGSAFMSVTYRCTRCLKSKKVVVK
jgi:hypothetical protein